MHEKRRGETEGGGGDDEESSGGLEQEANHIPDSLKKEQWAGPRRHVHTAMQGVVQQLLEGRGLSFPCYTNFFLPSSSLLLLRLQHEHVFFYI